MDTTAQPTSYNATQLDANQRKQLALESLRQSDTVTALAKENNVSRKFIDQQKDKALDAVNESFAPPKQPADKILFYLPVTWAWLCQLILCLVLHCRANHRGIQKLLADAFDHPLSTGSIHNMVQEAKMKAKIINQQQDLSHITLAAQDATFHYNKPVLTGVDIRSLYCYLLSSEDQRDFDTWGTHLFDLQTQGFHPERVVGDDASPIRSALHYVYPKVPYDLDNVHILRDLMELRRYFRNSLKSTMTNRKTLQEKVEKSVLTIKNETYTSQLNVALINAREARYLSQSIDTLVSWMQHAVLNMPGLAPTLRYELFDFVLDELKQLAQQHPHRIQTICTTLQNQKNFLLAFTEVLDKKFEAIADEFVCPIEIVWAMCSLQRCQRGSDKYAIRSLPLQDYFGYDFDAVEDAVIKALATTERTSSMIENLHSRIKPYFLLRREIGFDYLELLQFSLNHTPFQRSAREERKGRTPTEILTGESHPHWLDMLGYQRFKKAA